MNKRKFAWVKKYAKENGLLHELMTFTLDIWPCNWDLECFKGYISQGRYSKEVYKKWGEFPY